MIPAEHHPVEDLERVVLTIDLPAQHLKAGDVGTVVHVYDDGKAYEIEFCTFAGDTIDVVTVEAHQVRRAAAAEIPHARRLVG